MHQGMYTIEVEGAEAAGAAGFLVALLVPVPEEYILVAQFPEQAGYVGARVGASAPASRYFRVLGFQTLLQGATDFGQQEVEGHVGDTFLVFQHIGHDDQVGDAATVLTVARAPGKFQLGQSLVEGRNQTGGQGRRHDLFRCFRFRGIA